MRTRPRHAFFQGCPTLRPPDFVPHGISDAADDDSVIRIVRAPPILRRDTLDWLERPLGTSPVGRDGRDTVPAGPPSGCMAAVTGSPSLLAPAPRASLSPFGESDDDRRRAQRAIADAIASVLAKRSPDETDR